MKRRELREHIFELLFRVEFNERDEMPEQMRLFFESLPELSPEDQAYMQKKYERIMEKLPRLTGSWRDGRGLEGIPHGKDGSDGSAPGCL